VKDPFKDPSVKDPSNCGPGLHLVTRAQATQCKDFICPKITQWGYISIAGDKDDPYLSFRGSGYGCDVVTRRDSSGSSGSICI
jgi:hypothetical protein